MTIRAYDPADYELGEFVDFEYPDNIPTEVRGRPIRWRRSEHVGGLFVPHYAWNPDYIPQRYQNLLCYGSIPTNLDKHTTFTKRRGIIICGDCDKPKVYNSHWCIQCGEFFIKDFIDTRFCSAFPFCWDCLDDVPWDEYCRDHALPAHVEFSENGDTTIIPPVGLNPKVFTAEELENVFDF